MTIDPAVAPTPASVARLAALVRLRLTWRRIGASADNMAWLDRDIAAATAAVERGP